MAAMLEVISFFVIAVGFIEATGTCGTVEATSVETSDGWTKFTHKQPWLVKIEIDKNIEKESVTEKCLGAAITEKLVLTAGACVENTNKYKSKTYDYNPSMKNIF